MLASRAVRAGLAVIASFGLAVCLLLASHSPRTASAAFVTPPVFTAPIQAAGLTETWTIKGWQGSAPNHLTSATVTFPAGFVIPSSPTVTVTASGVACPLGPVVVTGQSVAISITGRCESSAPPPQQSITIAGVTNPTTAGTLPAAGFKLATSIDAEMSASAAVAIWGVTTGPVACTQSGGLSTAEIRFTVTGDTAAGNTGSGVVTPFLVTTSRGSLRWSPYFEGTWGTMTPAAGAVAAVGSVSAGVAPGAVLVVGVALNGSAATTVMFKVSPVNGGTAVVLGSRDVNFLDSACVPPAATPAPAGTFSGGTIAASGVSLVSFTGTTAQLASAGAAAKVVTVTATVGGKMITFVVGSPDFVNVDFNAAFPNGLSATLVIVKT